MLERGEERGSAEPTVTVVIPTLNSAKTMKSCLESITAQEYPADKLDIVIADAGSTDSTIEIIESVGAESKFPITVVPNPLKTGEAGKAAGLKSAKGAVIALIDSDNILFGSDWLKRMVEPFGDKRVVASEPIEYTYRKGDGYITRYCALIGMNDPLCLFLGNYDRYSAITGLWTEMPHKADDRGGYLAVEFDKERLPTIGANGFLIYRSVLESCDTGEYLFDIDVIYELLDKAIPSEPVLFAKVKTGIIHIFSGDVKTFARKQRRRIRDYQYYNKLGVRKYPWKSHGRRGLVRFMLSCVTVVPLLLQSLRGFMRVPDSAWLFHAVACWVTLYEYGLGTISGLFGAKELTREGWKQ
ncbi:MAG: glycosyltransferase family 2 protein [Proteobacteria bacterium]|nr:glycosyltransferase family 2 protein [Pseudomonadota bacterium]